LCRLCGEFSDLTSSTARFRKRLRLPFDYPLNPLEGPVNFFPLDDQRRCDADDPLVRFFAK